MALNNLLEGVRRTHRNLAEKYEDLYCASLAFLTVKTLDQISTSLYLHKYHDLEKEGNDLARSAMELLGIDVGLTAYNIPAVAGVIGAGYLLNRFGQDCETELARKTGPLMVFGSALVGVPIVINNFLEYLS